MANPRGGGREGLFYPQYFFLLADLKLQIF